jgi:hypothetical protein
MNNRLSDTDSLLGTVDLRGLLETVRLRWWVIPAVVAVSVGFLQAQESDLRTEPASYLVSRSYAIPNPVEVLHGVGVPVGGIREIPDADTQILVLKSTEVRDEIAAKVGKEVNVQVPDNFETPFTLSCNEPVKADCEKATELYAEKAAEIRSDAIRKGLERLRELLVRLQESTPDPLSPPKIAVIDALLADFQVQLVYVDGFEQSIGPTVDNVRRPTYVLGVAAGLLVSLLILLQLTFTDGRVRSVRQLVRLVGSDNFLGATSKKLNSVRDRRTAVAMSHGLAAVATRVRYVPIRLAPKDEAPLARLAGLAGAPCAVSSPFADLTVPELTKPVADEADVIVVQRNRDRRKDLLEVFAALQRSGRRLAGVLLVD